MRVLLLLDLLGTLLHLSHIVLQRLGKLFVVQLYELADLRNLVCKQGDRSLDLVTNRIGIIQIRYEQNRCALADNRDLTKGSIVIKI